MNNKIAAVALALSVLALSFALSPDKGTQAIEKKETHYERILRTKTIRCAYMLSPFFMVKDPNTGKMSGVYYDLVEKIGEDLGVKIEWAEEVGAASMYEGFQTNRTDMLCSPNTIAPNRLLKADMTRPIGYLPYYLYVRDGDMRFDNAYDKANDSAITMMTFDGYYGAVLMKEYFPKAKSISLPDLTNDIDVLLGLSAGKADAAVCSSLIASEYMENNPNKLRKVIGEPIRYPSLLLALPLGEEKLKTVINLSLTYYLETGVVEKILTKHKLDPVKFLRVKKPYEIVR